MWPAFLVYSVYWIFLSRRQMRNTWPEVAVTLLLQLAMFGAIAWLFPPWAWKITLLASITMPWWIAPLQLWRGTRLPARSGEAAYDPERHPVPPELRVEVERQADVLMGAGLVRLGTFWHQALGGTNLRTLLESPDGLEMAMVSGYEMVVREGTPAEHRRQEVDCAVAVRSGGERRLVVANAVPEMMPRTPGARLEMVPALRDPAQLLAFARAYRARFAADERLEPVRGGVPPLEHLQAHEARSWQGQVVTVMGVLNHILPGTESEVRYTHVSTSVAMVFADGRRLGVVNTDLTPPPAPGTVLESFTRVDDPARLLRIARAYAAREYGTARRVPVRGGESVQEHLLDRHRANLRAQAERGVYRRHADGEWYTTLRGALVMGWGLLFPFWQVGALRRRMRERRILRELGMEDATAAPFPRPHTRHPFDVHCIAAVAIALLLVLLD